MMFKINKKKILNRLNTMKLRHLQKLAAIIVMAVLGTVSSCKKNLTPSGRA